MPRWWSGGPGSAATPAELLAEADALYQEAAVELPQRGLHTMALRAATDAADRYRRALRASSDPASRWPVKRKLALAVWRQSMLLNMLGRPKEAMKPGREGLALGRELLATLPPGSPGTDELVGEVATAMNDLRQAAIAGRFADEIGDLQQEVVALCEAHPGPRARQALGTALHNEAAVMAGIAYQALAQGIRADPAAVTRLTSLMDRAVGIRQGLADPARPMTLWELANSLLLRGKVSCLACGCSQRWRTW